MALSALIGGSFVTIQSITQDGSNAYVTYISPAGALVTRTFSRSDFNNPIITISTSATGSL